MSDRHNTPLLYSQETGIATTYCDAISPAPVEKKSLSALQLPQGQPAKRAANLDAPRTCRGPAIPDSVLQAGRKNPLTPHPPTRPPPPALPPLYNSWMLPSVILPSAAGSVCGVPSGSAWRSGESDAPPSLAQAPAEHGKRGAVLHRRARIETHVTRNTRRTRNTRQGGFQRHNRTIRA